MVAVSIHNVVPDLSMYVFVGCVFKGKTGSCTRALFGRNGKGQFGSKIVNTQVVFHAC